MQVVLAGNPNAGKTTLFNALTHSNLKTGNWHGVTTAPASKTTGNFTFTDVPGMYSFNAYSMEEISAAESAKSADLIINVVDALTLENSLNLTGNLISYNKNTVVYLTKLKQLKARGGRVDKVNLQKYLGVPVYDCPPKQLKKLLESGKLLYPVKKEKIALDKAYSAGNCNLNRAEKLFYNKGFAVFFFIAAMVFTFFITFHPIMPGALLKGLTERLVCVTLADAIASVITNPVLESLVCEGIIGGVGGVLSFLPQITVLYLMITLLDESGIMSALCFVTDGVFEKVNLSGRAAFSLVSGFGCTAAAISTTKGFTGKTAQSRTVKILPFIPCGAKLPVFLTFLSPLFKNPFPAVCALYFSGIAFSLAFSCLLKGEREGLITEITPVSLPSFKAVKNKLCFYVLSFIIKVSVYVFVFCAVSWFLSHFSFSFAYVELEGSMLCAISKLITPLFYPMGVTDWRLAYAITTGFAAKENVAATVSMLYPEGLNLQFAPSMAVCAFILTCPACISAFAASVKQVGLKQTAVNNSVQLAFSFAFAYIVHFIFAIL